LDADKLERGFVDPEKLIRRLRQLKPSNNFDENRHFEHPYVCWENPGPLEEEGHEVLPPSPQWLIKLLYGVNDLERRMIQKRKLGRSDVSYEYIKESAAQFSQDIRNRRAKVVARADLAPLPNSHLLKDMGRSPGGTPFPRSLVEGLVALRDHANIMGLKSYDEEYSSAMTRREEVITCWQKRNPDTSLAYDTLVIYRTWPVDLMAQLEEIDSEAIRRARKKYVDYLREAEARINILVTFWQSCNLTTGHRTPFSCWPRSLLPSAINTEAGSSKAITENWRIGEIDYEAGLLVEAHKPASHRASPKFHPRGKRW